MNEWVDSSQQSGQNLRQSLQTTAYIPQPSIQTIDRSKPINNRLPPTLSDVRLPITSEAQTTHSETSSTAILTFFPSFSVINRGYGNRTCLYDQGRPHPLQANSFRPRIPDSVEELIVLTSPQ